MRPELDTKNPPGQQVNVPKEHLQLSDYIRSINRREALDNVASEKKLSFEEWAVGKGYAYYYALNKMQWSAGTRLCEEEVRGIWNAAQENKK